VILIISCPGFDSTLSAYEVMKDKMDTLETRIQRIEDRLAIHDLVATYGRVVDDRRVEELSELFSVNGRFRSADGVMDARGRNAVIEQFRGRFSVLGMSNHVTHDLVVTLDPVNPDKARGVLGSHAEVVRNGRTLVTALRYEDEYIREEGRWRFADRLLSFLYYVPADEYAEAMASSTRMRV